ncbi:hypothetical protein T35B1_12157 [Salinisphaera shabanensis T35B1]|uniref:CsbD family protein n=1 Tax=Salinisphaera shabanensis TaxID=180542 RepID=UPI00333FAD64
MVDDDRKTGKADRVKGAVKEGVGKVTGDEHKEAEGKAQRKTGKVQDKVGQAKDKVRDKLKD